MLTGEAKLTEPVLVQLPPVALVIEPIDVLGGVIVSDAFSEPPNVRLQASAMLPLPSVRFCALVAVNEPAGLTVMLEAEAAFAATAIAQIAPTSATSRRNLDM